jgi:hypothetical protein
LNIARNRSLLQREGFASFNGNGRFGIWGGNASKQITFYTPQTPARR